MDYKIYAHKDENGNLEELQTHLYEVSQLCGAFANSFDSEQIGILIGKAHDIGKCTLGFQRRLLENGSKVDHSTVGAKLLINNFPIGAYCVIGHHSGLPDGGSSTDSLGLSTLQSRIKKNVEPLITDDFNLRSEDFQLHFPQLITILNLGCTASMYIRMLFSCLVDADFLSTESFMNPFNKRRSYTNFNFRSLEKELYEKIKSFDISHNKINMIRTEIFEDCTKKANLNRGIYSLSVPTGTGKTLSSFSYALNHLLVNNLKRIIYVIPYTSIIEQNADVFRKIFGNIVLEHHSNFDFDCDNDESSIFQLASENWDMPIIVTTNVQFFNSLYSNKVSKTRKLHNIVNSVIVFDEVQMLPIEYLKPCLYSLSELVLNYHCSILLCSATQPPFEKILSDFKVECKSLINKNYNEVDELKRVVYNYIKIVDDEYLVSSLLNQNQALCIVNSREQAKQLFKLLSLEYQEGVFYLTTDLCPIHRTQRIKKIKYHLKNNYKCIVISTSLVEAGVDFDFPIVYRAIAGVDNIIQSAGRCNREGKRKRENSIVNIFKPEEKYAKSTPKNIIQKSKITELVIKEKGFDFNNKELIELYYTYYYKIQDDKNLDIKEILAQQSCSLSNIPFKKIAKDFSLIDDNQCSIIIPFDSFSTSLVQEIKNGFINAKMLRKLHKYSVNVRKWKLDQLLKMHAVKDYEGILILDDVNKYNENLGLGNALEDSFGSYFY